MEGKVAVALPGIQLHGALQTLVGLAAGARRAAAAPVGITLQAQAEQEDRRRVAC
jgi:hypothetical protein